MSSRECGQHESAGTGCSSLCDGHRLGEVRNFGAIGSVAVARCVLPCAAVRHRTG
jgi:hypothetical protein